VLLPINCRHEEADMEPIDSVIKKDDSGPTLQVTGRQNRVQVSHGLDAPHKFEAYLIQTMVEQMLPEHAASAFGSGFSGSAWRSMMAERVADVVAAHGGFGIAAQMEHRTVLRT
jgi:Rod binding domain-containing protein